MVIIKWCDECKKRSYKIDVCTNCGLVFEDRPLDYRETKKQKKQTFDDGNTNFDYIRKKLFKNVKQCNSLDLRRAFKKSYYSWDNKREDRIKNEVKRVCSLLNLNVNYHIRVMYFYKKLVKFNESQEKNMFRKRIPLEALAQALVFIQVKRDLTPRNLYDFKSIGCDIEGMKTYYTGIVEKMNLKFRRIPPAYFVERIVAGLELESRDEFILTFAAINFLERYEMIETIYSFLTLFRSPVVKAAGSVYILSRELYGVKQRGLANIIGCDVRTISKRVSEIGNTLNMLKMFSYEKEAFKLHEIDVDEYNKLAESGAEYLEKDFHLVNGLINPNLNLKIEKGKLIFY